MRARLIIYRKDKTLPDGKFIISMKEFNPLTIGSHPSSEMKKALQYADLIINGEYDYLVTMEFVRG